MERLTVAEAVARYGVNRRSLERAIQKGEIPVERAPHASANQGKKPVNVIRDVDVRRWLTPDDDAGAASRSHDTHAPADASVSVIGAQLAGVLRDLESEREMRYAAEQTISRLTSELSAEKKRAHNLEREVKAMPLPQRTQPRIPWPWRRGHRQGRGAENVIHL